MKKTILTFVSAIIFAIAFIPALNGQEFDKNFTNQTLRADYIFAGNASQQSIYLDKLSRLEGWAGRRCNLSMVPVEGNGQIEMKDKESGETIYINSFSSLFQEWLCEPEAAKLSKGFEYVCLLPMPAKMAEVTVRLMNARREIVAELTHEIDPSDILIHDVKPEQTTPHKYILQSGSSEECIDVVIIAEGYTESEMETFYADAQDACDAIFSHDPFSSYKERFNFIAVASPSVHSGVSIPREDKWLTTAVGSHFDTFYSDRYLTTLNVKKINDLLAGIPYEHIIILANTDTYGGGGIYNSYTLTTAHHPKFKPVVVHEFGHSFAALADEYAYSDDPSPMYPYDIEPWEQNITTKVDFASKWEGFPGTRLVEGGGYTNKGVYRSREDCRMRTNTCKDFCPVCQMAIEQMILFNTSGEF